MASKTIAKLKRLKDKTAALVAKTRGEESVDSPADAWDRGLRFCRLVAISFVENRCPVRASALAYTTLLALIPLLAITLSVTTSLLKSEGQKPIETLIDRLVAYVAPELDLAVQTRQESLAPSPLVTQGDLQDVAGLLQELRLATNTLTQLLTNRLAPHAGLWNSPDSPAEPDDASRRLGLVQALNELIQGETLYEAGRFENIPLRSTTLAAAKGDSAGVDRARLNRWLLEDAFPAALARSALTRRQEVVARITDFIANIRTGTLTVTGTIALVFIAIGLLRTIEAAFNDIWGVTRGRGWLASIVQYWALITLGPLLVAVTLGVTSGPYVAATARWITAVPFAVRLAPFVVLSLGFAVLYKLMPNTTVRWSAALVGGTVGGCLWQFNSLFSFLYVSRVVTYSTIYGSLGVVPLFLVGLYVSWLILLLGAQVAYTFQNLQASIQERQTQSVHQQGRELVGLHLITQIARHFHAGRPAPTAQQLADALGVPSRLSAQILEILLKARLLIEVADTETRYAPARPLARITAHDVLEALRTGQGRDIQTRPDPARALVNRELVRFRQAEHDAARQVTLEDLVQHAEGDDARQSVADLKEAGQG
ncbi:MAG: YihY family inner membrane protein [Verrucomicrobia bacterium]|nr:YihY family inner membrane protein [Verrucomicrobiota bacterium]